MYNVKQTQQEILDLREKLTMQQQRIQLNEQSSEREGKDKQGGWLVTLVKQEK